TASVLFYDLISDKAFDSNPKRPDALWYLADSLYQQSSYASARLYLRQLLAQDTPRYRDALARYLEASAKLNDWGDLEPYLARPGRGAAQRGAARLRQGPRPPRRPPPRRAPQARRGGPPPADRRGQPLPPSQPVPPRGAPGAGRGLERSAGALPGGDRHQAQG